jgi:transmembrane secretion effector
MRRLLADVAPLRGPSAFRRLWVGQLVSGIGSQMTVFAVALQVYRMTSSSLAVGAIGLVGGAAGISVGMLAGGFVDAVDRRRLVLLVTGMQLLVSGALTVQAFTGAHALWLLYVLVAVQAALAAVGAPARQTFLPHLLPVGQLSAGAALQMLAGRAGWVLGPSLAGVLTAAGGLRLCYLADTVSFLAAVRAAAGLPRPKADGSGSRDRGPHAIAEGLRFIGSSRVLVGVLLADISATLLALPVALFPAINAERFDGNPQTLGLMSTAMALGGIAGSAFSGPVGRVQRQGRGMLIAVAIWGLAVASFGLAHGLAGTLLALAVADAADVSSLTLRSTVIMTATPEAFRGRVAATDYVVGSSVPELGNFRAGAVATVTSPAFSALTGGLAATGAAGILALCFPALVRYRAETTTAASPA